MSNLRNRDWLIEVQKGNIAGHSVVQKFGHNPLVGTSFVPVTSIGAYPTPQVSGATTLRIKAGGSANDTAAGTGAREIELQGLDETGAYVTETLATAGASASSVTTTTFMRLYRIYVTASGTYASSAAASHEGAIVIENGTGGTDWAQIDLNDFANSQSKIGVYTVPLGKTAYILSARISAESTKVVDAVFFQRQGILETAAPYSAMRVNYELAGITDTRQIVMKSSTSPFPELTDIGFMAKVASGTADVDVDFEILLVDN